ncbi:hypothetical protein ACHAXS_008663, partial [Conticribra weissflogii]
HLLPWWHPEIQYIADELIPGPPNHPLLDDDYAFQVRCDQNKRYYPLWCLNFYFF